MYNIKLCDYVPKPEPATSKCIVAAHYYAAWKKGAAGIHNGFDDLHSFPERTPLHGYYDEEDPALADWEIKWALEHGINCFIHCWYRLKHNEGKPVSLGDLRCAHALHEAFFNARYQNMMQFAIMFENNLRWANTDPRDLVENLMPFWVENYFKRDNYLKIDGKPVLFVCSRPNLDSVFSSAAEQREVFQKCRDYAAAQGLGGLLIAPCMWDYDNLSPEAYREPQERGYDFFFSYDSGYSPEKSFPEAEEIIEGQLAKLENRFSGDESRAVATASCFADATPRTTKAWNDLGYTFGDNKIWYLKPEKFRELIKRMQERIARLPENAIAKRLFMIDNWNEWDEGHYVAPSHEFGFKYLQAIREELSKKDNLPDYRMPQDIGLSDFNKSWGKPDLREACSKKFNLK